MVVLEIANDHGEAGKIVPLCGWSHPVGRLHGIAVPRMITDHRPRKKIVMMCQSLNPLADGCPPNDAGLEAA